jgi:methylmalonyl-CoA mutase cobalamin-binding domain/chain
MTDLSARPAPAASAARRLRFVTAASLFDGHDASINIIRRMLMASGAEVIHLGHNRSVDEIVTAALQEDAHGIAVSSYQGGHIEFFKYAIDLLRERGGANIKLFGGGVTFPPRSPSCATTAWRASTRPGRRRWLAGHDRPHAVARPRTCARACQVPRPADGRRPA